MSNTTSDPYNGVTKPASRPLNRDALSMLPRGISAQSAHLALSAIQEERPEVMVMGAAVLFAALCHRCQLDPQAMHHMGLKVLNADALGFRKDNASLQSLRDFAGIRVMGEKTVSIS